MPSTLELIKTKLALSVPTTWSVDVQTQGELVALYRDYAAGQHRAKMTPAMKRLLRIDDERSENFVDNYCDLVIEKMADRLSITQVKGDNDAATAWSDALLADNRIDALQMDVHEAAIRDGVTYVMVTYDNARQRPMLVHELAYDGDVGMIAVYDRMGRSILAAVKVWYEGDDKRINIYRASQVDRYVMVGGAEAGVGQLSDLGSIDWTTPNGQPIGVPVAAFINRARPRMTTGISEIGGILSLQDALNRTVVSMVMTAELTAFQIRLAVGFNPPANITPGMWVIAGADGVGKDQQIDARTLEQGEIVPFIDQAKFLIDQISAVTSTPLPGAADSAASGEALKQREIGLLGKIKRFQIRAGNSWEDVMGLAAAVQGAFGSRAVPAYGRWTTLWSAPEMRNDSQMIDNALKLREIVGDRETLRMVAPVYNWSAGDIDRIMNEREAQVAESLAALGGSLPGFDRFALSEMTMAPDAVEMVA